MPDRFGKKNGPSWRTWSYLARDVVGVVHAGLKQAMKNVENRKLPIAVTNLQHDFGVMNEMEQKIQHFFIARTEGEALEVVRGAEREPGLEQCRRLFALYDPFAAGRSQDDRRQILSETESCQYRRPLTTPPKPGKTLNNETEKRTGDPLHKDMRLGILLFMCPTDLVRELTATAALVPRLGEHESSHRNSHQQSHTRSCSNDDEKIER